MATAAPRDKLERLTWIAWNGPSGREKHGMECHLIFGKQTAPSRMLSADVTGNYAAVSDLDIRTMSVQRRMTRDIINQLNVITPFSQSKITSMRRWKRFGEHDQFYAMVPTSNSDIILIRFFMFSREYSEFMEGWSQGQGYDEGCRFYVKKERIDCGESSSSFYAEAKPSAYLDSFHPTLFQY
ncbi:MAG: hypothetical protein VCF07_00375 [Nitrospinota bacterium]